MLSKEIARVSARSIPNLEKITHAGMITLSFHNKKQTGSSFRRRNRPAVCCARGDDGWCAGTGGGGARRGPGGVARALDGSRLDVDRPTAIAEHAEADRLKSSALPSRGRANSKPPGRIDLRLPHVSRAGGSAPEAGATCFDGGLTHNLTYT